MNKITSSTLLLSILLSFPFANNAAISDAMPNSDDARFILRSLIVFAAIQMYSPASVVVSRWVYGPSEKEKLQEHALKNETLKYIAALPEITEQLKTKVEKSAKDFEEDLVNELKKLNLMLPFQMMRKKNFIRNWSTHRTK